MISTNPGFLMRSRATDLQNPTDRWAPIPLCDVPQERKSGKHAGGGRAAADDCGKAVRRPLIAGSLGDAVGEGEPASPWTRPKAKGVEDHAVAARTDQTALFVYLSAHALWRHEIASKAPAPFSTTKAAHGVGLLRSATRHFSA